MALYFIGLGLGNEKDITLKGLEAVKKCDVLYLEGYTSVLGVSKDKLEEFYGKKITIARRNDVEKDDNSIIEDAKTKNVGFLVAGDSLSATTHIDLYMRAKKEGIKCFVIHNASIMTAIGITGLQLYKFGKTTSIPFANENVEAPYDALYGNLSLGLHTLFLLDLNPEEYKFMSVGDALRYLLKIELKRNEKVISEKSICVGCARVGTETQVVKAGTVKDILKHDFGKGVQCLIIVGKMHFVEEDALKMWH
jgi:diphthine synthase